MTNQAAKWRVWLLAVAMLILGAALGVAFTKGKDGAAASQAADKAANNDKQSADVRAVMTVEAIRPNSDTLSESIFANGVIAATQTAQVSGRLTGVVVEQVAVEVGSRVQKGQLLAVLDTKTLHEQVAQAQADLAVAMASKEQAAANLARLEPLLTIDAVSRQEVELQRTALRQATANITAATARLNTAKNNEKNARITAPVSGVISSKNAQVGVLATGAPLFEIIKDNQLEWQATLTPDLAAQLSVGMAAQLEINGKTIAGSITRLSPTANNAHEMIAHVRLPAGSGAAAGAYVSGRFELGGRAHYFVPRSAILTRDGYHFVWSLLPSGDLYQVARTSVEIYGDKGDQVATDLPQDALIVAQSGDFISEGDLVRAVLVNDTKGELPVADAAK